MNIKRKAKDWKLLDKSILYIYSELGILSSIKSNVMNIHTKNK